MTPLLHFENTTIVHQGKVILRDLTLHVSEGQKLLIDGPSGCGKSSLLRALLGFVEITEGTYTYRGQAMTPSQMNAFRQTTGFVPQELDVGSGPISAWTAELMQNETRFHEHLSDLHLDPTLLAKDLQQLSRGERQRLTLALVMSRRPSVFLLDEVTSSLQTDLKQRLADQFAQMTGVTVIAISHDPAWQDHLGFEHCTLDARS